MRLFSLVVMAVGLLIIGCDWLNSDDPIDYLSNPLRRVFLGRLTYPTGETPYEALVGDLNRDGLPDVVTLNWVPETASVLLADGAGGFAEAVTYELGAAPRAAVLCDLSGNGVLDLAVVNEQYAQVTLLFGDGNGGFDASTALNLVPESGPRAIAAADLNMDGVMDLVTADTAAGTVTLLVGEGAGAFLEPVSVPVEQAPAGIWVGDLDGDGITDIVTAHPDTDTLHLLQGTGVNYLPGVSLPCGHKPQLVTAVDLDNNGLRDLVAGNAGSGDLSVLYALGDGQFSAETRIALPYPAGRFVVADFSGNTIPDIAAVLFDKTGEDRQPISRLALLRGNGPGEFGEAAVYGSGWGAIAVTAADMNNSGRLDLVTADYSTDTISIAYNRGNAAFESDRRFAVGAKPRKAVTADFTEDGRDDIAVLNYNDNTVSIMEAKGDGTFEALSPVILTGKPLTMTSGDLNNDGREDIVVSITGQTQVFVYLAVGPGVFAAPQFFPVQTDNSQGAPEALSLALGDVNNDGSPDIVAGNSRTDTVAVLLNNGTGRFNPPIITNAGNYPRDVHLADTNGDGNLDLVFLSSRDPLSPNDNADPRVVRWFGRGDGTFDEETHLRFATGSEPQMMAMADITGNGCLDAVTVHTADNSVYVLGGLKNGNFSKASRIYVGYRPVSVTLADINRDGRADLIATLNAGSVVMRYSRGDLKFEDPNNFIVSTGMAESVVADVNGDGILDLIVVNSSRNDLGVLLGQAL